MRILQGNGIVSKADYLKGCPGDVHQHHARVGSRDSELSPGYQQGWVIAAPPCGRLEGLESEALELSMASRRVARMAAPDEEQKRQLRMAETKEKIPEGRAGVSLGYLYGKEPGWQDGCWQ